MKTVAQAKYKFQKIVVTEAWTVLLGELNSGCLKKIELLLTRTRYGPALDLSFD